MSVADICRTLIRRKRKREFGNDCLAHPSLAQAVSISLRAAFVCSGEERPSVAEGGFSRHRRQSSFSETRKATLEMPGQDKGETMIVGHSYSLARVLLSRVCLLKALVECLVAVNPETE